MTGRGGASEASPPPQLEGEELSESPENSDATKPRRLLVTRGGAPTAPGFPTFVVVHLVPVAVDHVGFQEVQEGARNEEAVGRGEVLDVARVQREGVGWRGDGAQAHQLADDVPHTNT